MSNFKSTSERYFSYYLEELQEAGFIKKWYYEQDTWELTPKLEITYLKRLKTKIKEETEFLLHPSSITADFTIIWEEKARNIFFLDVNLPIKDVKLIPFRVSEFVRNRYHTYVECKQVKTFKANNSDISFPYKQKFLYQLYEIYLQKIKPFTPNNSPTCLFKETFTPMKVAEEERYVKRTADNKIGDSKLKYKVRTLKEFLND